tara:strand:- start:1957 stop:2181 length:225 start_codon:yes stop_codon:yes gene_type:complete
MITKPSINTEPVRFATALTAAIIATINVLGLIFNWSADLIAGQNIAASAWVGLLGVWLRSRVTPTASIPPPEFA